MYKNVYLVLLPLCSSLVYNGYTNVSIILGYHEYSNANFVSGT